MPGYYLWTIGCQMNKADSQQLAHRLQEAGYQPAPTMEQADLIVVNSCVVRQSAEDRAVRKLQALTPLKRRRSDLFVLLTGCIVDSQERELKQRFPYVDFFFRPQDWEAFDCWAEEQGILRYEEKVLSPSSSPPVSAFLPIIQGCDNFCTYCIVPFRRGRERSHPPHRILCEAEKLVRQGTKEIVLLGQNVDSYGHDLPGKPDLADLLRELNQISGLLRIRFLTSHPKDMSPRLIQAIGQLEKVCEHLSLPVQAGDNTILEAMRRGYTVEQYRQLVSDIRQAITNVALSTDVIVGFPGEARGQFLRTAELLREIRFDTVHAAVYSPRPGTWASRMLRDDVPPREKKQRQEEIEQLQQQIAGEINAQLLGRTAEVLVEQKEKGKWQGRTRTNKLVFFSDPGDWRGRLVGVKIDSTSPWSLQGAIERAISA